MRSGVTLHYIAFISSHFSARERKKHRALCGPPHSLPSAVSPTRLFFFCVAVANIVRLYLNFGRNEKMK